MFWWHKAAELVRASKTEKFGFITTNSIKQTFNRRVIESHMQADPPLSITLAIPDHPWVDSADGAAVEIAMTVAEKGDVNGRILYTVSETKTDGLEVRVSFNEKDGKIHSDLSIGANVVSARTLKSNEALSCPGVKLHGAGFIIDKTKAEALGLGKAPGIENHIREYRNGKDLTSSSRGVMVIDLFGLAAEEVRNRFPEVYQWVFEHVKPERDHNNRASYKNNWWIHGEPRGNFRPALKGLKRYVATVETSKHRFFTFLDESVLPDNMLVAIATEDAYHLGVLSSSLHVKWALATGSDLGGNTPRYNKTRCFETFPLPETSEDQKTQIRSIAEQLDAHRKQRQALHPTLTITDMYNVVEKLRSGEALIAKEQKVHEQGLVSILKQLHDELDAAVAAAYGWPANLAEEEILERLVALNKERAAEEARGLVRWLRPEYQNPQGVQQTGIEMETPEVEAAKVTDGELVPWPRTLAEQAQAVQRALQLQERPVTAEDLYRHFKQVPKGQMAQRVQQIESLLQTLQGLGLLRRTEGGMYVK